MSTCSAEAASSDHFKPQRLIRAAPEIIIDAQDNEGNVVDSIPFQAPNEVFPDEEGSSVGTYMREVIVYMCRHVDRMANEWSEYRRTATNFHRSTSRLAVEDFWMGRNSDLRKENFQLIALTDEVRWACLYLHGLFRVRKTPKAYQNLQRRCEYLLMLCLLAIADSRLVASDSRYYEAEEGVQDGVKTPNDLRQLLGYNSGLGDGCPSWRYLSTLYLADKFCVDPNGKGGKWRVKLPRHFVELMRTLYGECSLPRLAFANLLGRYALFLSLLIWNPTFYDTYRKVWDDPYTILDIPRNFEHVFFRDPIPINLYCFHEKYKGAADSSALQDTTRRCGSWTDDMPFVSKLDETEMPTPHTLWDRFYIADYKTDMLDSGNLWLRMMR